MPLALDDPRLVAFHESGHALFATIARRQIEFLTVDLRTGAGCCRSLPPSDSADLSPEARLAGAASDLAGLGAEALAVGLDEITLDEAATGNTWARVDVGRARADFSPEILDDLWVLTLHTLRTFWPVVDALAGALATAGRLDGAQVAEIVDAAFTACAPTDR